MYWLYNTYHDTVVTIQHIAIHCDTVSNMIYCLRDMFLLLIVSVVIVALELKSQMAKKMDYNTAM